MTSPPPRAAELRRDVVTNRWVILSPARSRRPSDHKSPSPSPSPSSPNPNPNSKPCPFCLGNEHLCAPELFRLPPSSPQWRLRVIENLFPALHRSLPPPPDPPTPLSIPAFGVHDVVIETPSHNTQLSDLAPGAIGDVLLAYKQRILQIKEDVNMKYVQVFKNHGASAGASLSHSHSQIVGMPVVPPAVGVRLGSMGEWFERSGKCVLCEETGEELLVEGSGGFRAVAPFAASAAFEVWIVPREHSAHFHDIDQEKAVDLGGLLKLMLLKLSRQLNDPPFNFMIHTSPFELPDSSLPYAHWYLQIVPQLSVIGGFETATGCYINPVFPEEAAKVLREVKFPE